VSRHLPDGSTEQVIETETVTEQSDGARLLDAILSDS
jgi:hypothetical protein